jgi:alanine racemase
VLESASRAWAEVSAKAIRHNLAEVRKLAGKTKVMGIVKANAYGHGDVFCASILATEGVDFFGVSSVDEAIVLREGGIDQDILILGYTPPEHFHYLSQYNLVQSLLSKDYAEKLNAWAKEQNTTVRGHVKADTGMNRTGVQYQDACKKYDDIASLYRLSNVQTEGIFSHFPVSDDLGEEPVAFTRHQIDLFKEILSRLKADQIQPGLTHIQNSYGILNYGDLGFDYCRPGLLYMGVTSNDAIPIASDPEFIPALSLYANVSLVKTIPAGASVSYGRHFIADRPMQVATLSIGYADGLPRSLSNKGHEVCIGGKRVPLIGNICMDQCMADVTGLDVKEGDVATLVGAGLTVDEISRHAGTINNETLSMIAGRVPRLHV